MSSALSFFVSPFVFSPSFAQFAARGAWNPHFDMFAQTQGACMQIHKYKHSLKDILTQSSFVPKLIESESLISTQSVNSIHGAEENDVVVLIANTLLRRVEFGIWLSNTTEKFEISLGFAS